MGPLRRDSSTSGQEEPLALLLLLIIPLVGLLIAFIYFSPRIKTWWQAKQVDKRLRPLHLNKSPMTDNDTYVTLDAIGILISPPVSRLPKGYRKQEQPASTSTQPISKNDIARVKPMSVPPTPKQAPPQIDTYQTLCAVGIIHEPICSRGVMKQVKIARGPIKRSHMAAVDCIPPDTALPSLPAMADLTLPATVYQPEYKKEAHRRATLRQLEGRCDGPNMSNIHFQGVSEAGSPIATVRSFVCVQA